jgi:hypothetical protein
MKHSPFIFDFSNMAFGFMAWSIFIPLEISTSPKRNVVGLSNVRTTF